jgi:polysaccharide biosynthesis/export protein
LSAGPDCLHAARPFLFVVLIVIAPGQYPYVPNMMVETAVAIAGGFTPRAFRYDVQVSRSSEGVTARSEIG